jgi:hypothetical protein
VTVENSPWRKVYTSKDDQAMITLTGSDYNSCEYILVLFSPTYDLWQVFTMDWWKWLHCEKED